MTSQMTYELREVTSATERSLDGKALPVWAETSSNELILAPNAALHVCKIHTLRCCNLASTFSPVNHGHP